MRIVLAARSSRSVARATELLGGTPNLEIKSGSVPELAVGCDAEIMHFTLAHDRYGGSPIIGHSQVLHNLRNDGAPPVIIATPSLEDGAGLGGGDPDHETELHAERMIRIALDAWVASLGETAESEHLCCLIHLEGAGLDFGPLDPILRGVAKAIRPFIASAD